MDKYKQALINNASKFVQINFKIVLMQLSVFLKKMTVENATKLIQTSANRVNDWFIVYGLPILCRNRWDYSSSVLPSLIVIFSTIDRHD